MLASLKTHVQKYLWRRMRLHWTMPSGVRLEVTTLSDWIHFNNIFTDGEYDSSIRMALENRRHIEILDLGANIGFFSLRCIDLLRQQNVSFHITAIEGNPKTARELNIRLAQQSLEPDSVKAFNALVGERNGKGAITNFDLDGLNRVTDSGIEVEFADLETLLNGKTIDLLKCDIEGSEQLFLENYSDLMRRVRVAVFELHHTLCDTDKCMATLSSIFTSHKVLRDGPTSMVCQFWN
jgi:FkbM family methyltransferase